MAGTTALGIRAVAVLVAGLALASACSGGGESVEATLEAYALRDGDLAPGATLEPAPEGDRLDQVTLDLCGHEFASEADRVARRWVLVRHGPDGGDTEPVDGNENVAYATEEAAAAALDEIRTVVAECDPTESMPNPVEGLGPVRSDLRVADIDVPVDAVAVEGEVSFDRSSTVIDVAAVYLRRGRFVGIVYGSELAGITGAVRTVADRLGDLPAGDVS